MLDDMSIYYLEVGLVPSRHREIAVRGGMIRCTFNQNPQWYKKLCARYGSSRVRKSSKSDTRIRRQNIFRVLSRLADGKPSRSYYSADLIKIAAGRIETDDEVPF